LLVSLLLHDDQDHQGAKLLDHPDHACLQRDDQQERKLSTQLEVMKDVGDSLAILKAPNFQKFNYTYG
jgi:hypothetical protein